MTAEPSPRTSRSRSVAVAGLATLATLGAFVAGAVDAAPWIRWCGLLFGAGAAAASLGLATRRSGLTSWYIVTAVVLLWRVVRSLLG